MTISHWISGNRRPRLRNIFKEQPSSALSYIVGANKGDGCALDSGCVKLEVTDRDFAETFNSSMCELFSREYPNKVLVRRFKVERLPLFIVRYSSEQLVTLLRRPQKQIFEIAAVFPAEFLRGFFDAEGHVDVSFAVNPRLSIGAENSDRLLLLRIKWLLNADFGISSRIYQKRKAGSIKVIRGKTFTMKRTSYSLTIGKFDEMKTFADRVGFSIHRKAQKLKDALSIFESTSARDRRAMWERYYLKKRGEWVSRESSSN